MADSLKANSTDDQGVKAGNVREWIEQAIPPGSGRYYALLHSDPELQTQQQLITTLVSIFSKLGFQSREVEVAKHKLQWWRQELEKESFNHPVMAAFNNVTPVMKSQLKQLLNSYGSLIESGSPSTDLQNQQFHLDTGAAACHLLCDTRDTIQTVSDAGVVLSRFRCFRYLRQHVDSGLLCLPISSLETADISPAQLTPAARNKAVSDYFTSELTVLREDMQESLEALARQVSAATDEERRHYKALFVYLTLQYKLLHLMCKDNTSVVEEVTRLTPIRNYWHGFLAAREFDKI